MTMQFGPYVTESILGEGGMAVVFRAVHRSTGEIVALKASRPGLRADEAIRSEARALARVRDPGVVRVLAQGSEQGEPWYAMELFGSGTMHSRLAAIWAGGGGQTSTADTFAFDGTEEAGPPPTAPPVFSEAPQTRAQVANGQLQAVLDLFHALCRSLAALHANGIVHRDLKPANVFLREDGSPVVADLGLVSRNRGAFGREAFEVTGVVAGTVNYMSPEQARGLPVDARADLYSLGAMLFEALTGRIPLASPSALTALQRVLQEAARPPSDFVDGVPPALDALVLRLLEKPPNKRLGYAEDVAAVLEAAGARPAPLPFPGRTYLYRPALAGREEPLEALTRVLENTRKRRGGFALLEGESGVGKTTLAAAVASWAGTHGFAVLSGECLPERAGPDTRIELGGAPFHPLRGLLESVGDVCRNSSIAQDDGLYPALRILAGIEPSVASIPAVARLPEPQPVPPDVAAERTYHALRGVLNWWLSRRGPTLLVLDDLQWVDEQTGHFLTKLDADWLGTRPLLILATMRTGEGGEVTRQLRDRPDATAILVNRLDQTAVGAVVRDMLAWDSPPEKLVADLHRMSSGNPFFVAEYLRLAASEGFLVRQGGGWRVASDRADQALPEPASIAELVNARLSGLASAPMQLLETAAVLGRVFTLEHVGRATGLDEAAVDAALPELLARQIIESNGAEWRFGHDRLRETVYQTLADERRRQLHAAAANVLSADGATDAPWATIARHWREAGDKGRALEALEKAGEVALAAFANHDAVAIYKEAMVLAAELPEKPGPLRVARWERALGEASLDSGDVRNGLDYVGRALQSFGEPPLPVGNGPQAIKLIGQILTRVFQGWFPGLFKPKDPAALARVQAAAHLYNRLLEPSLMDGQVALAMFCGMRNINLADRGEPSVAMARGYGMMAAVVCVTPLRKLACEWADVGAAVGLKIGAPAAHGYALQRGAVAYLIIGDYAEARKRFTEALNILDGIGATRGREECDAGLLTLACHEGRYEDAAAIAAGLRRSARERGDAQVLASAEAFVLVIDGWRPGVQPEAGLREELMDRADKFTDTERMCAHGGRAIAAWRLGERAEARQAAQAVLAACRRAAPVTYILPPPLDATATVLGSLRERAATDGTADATELKALHEEMCAVLDKFTGMSPHIASIAALHRGLDHALAGRTAKAEKSWRAGLAEARKLGQKHTAGRLAMELALRVRPGDAEALKTEARALLQDCGDTVGLARLGT